ncbi:4-hydroxy-2-oxo-heptane-1,7-dioate aldolase [Alphaproteobacteria bacterium GH1-50]|uniref:4-hydroxy-2-oxo-heptane-1,7-dioate aldolase n=1 Tax=Kangsaoukella pontilimi TaxID=2691042 RepID=A0A7C9J5B6_9RHOB|nr:aldolase/citrate lyase family protein [Kangsaoukella pontilimi]MXQ09261.1 4-hydroxy-2-oxo-heptane-1,7-dioate aldolase [Kangsaoukella pontilimi]
MDLPKNTFKSTLLSGAQQIGYWCTIDDPTMTEMAAGCGFDWLLIDAEHTGMDPKAVLAHLHAASAYPVQTMVRPSSLDAAEIKKLLDFGAQSILVPYVRNAKEAAMAAEAVDYAPGGIRGVAGITRATRYGAVDNYTRRAREEICLVVQIETKSALDELEEICATPGVDAAFIGPADLAASLGFPGQPSHPEVKAACLDALRRIRAAGKPAGFLTLDYEFLSEAMEAGSCFTAVEVDSAALRRGAMASAARWKATTSS